MRVVACSKCGADLPEPDRYGNAWCVSCGAGGAAPASPKSAGELLSAVEMVASATRIAMTEDAVAELLQSRLSGHLYLHPLVPTNREQGARRMHYAHLPPSERILALYDASAMGSGEEGFLVTTRRLCWKNAGGTARMIEWPDVDADRLYAENGNIFVGGDAIAVDQDLELLDAYSDLFYVLANSARPPAAPSSSGVVPALAARPTSTVVVDEAPPRVHVQTTAPPPAGISYTAYVQHASSQPPPSWACWQCRTPLYRSTPQCSKCGAWPAPFGWLRTG